MRISLSLATPLAAAAVLTAFAALAQEAPQRDNPLQDSESWADLRGDIIGNVTLMENAALLDLEAPFRAHDPALVPVRLRQAEDAAPITELTLVVDENPAPVAGVFTFSEAMHPLDMEVRVRVERYSNIRAIAGTQGGHVMAGRFVRATGGCAAPAGKDAAAALAAMGQMRLQHLDDLGDDPEDTRRTAKLMLRHPNYSGLQRDQLTLLNIPARFIETLEVHQGDELLFSVTGGISISEDPVYQFRYRDNGADAITVRAVDTNGAIFQQSFARDTG